MENLCRHVINDDLSFGTYIITIGNISNVTRFMIVDHDMNQIIYQIVRVVNDERYK